MKKISNKISSYFAITTILVGIVFYFIIPNILNYPPDIINTEFDRQLSNIYYSYQYLITLFSIISIVIIYFKISLRKIDSWIENKNKDEILEIRKLCFTYPFKLFVTIEFLPVSIVILTLALIGNYPTMLLFKISILVFSFSTLVSSIFLMVSKKIFYPILKETSKYVKDKRTTTNSSLITRLIFQIFPSILVTTLLLSLTGYSILVEEKGNLLKKYYISQLKSLSISDSEDIFPQINNQLEKSLLAENDFVFVEMPNGKIITSNNQNLSEFFIEYMHKLSSSHDNTVYESYTVDEQGIIDILTYNGQKYTVGIHYEIVSLSLLSYFILSSCILFSFNLLILMHVAKSINNDLIQVKKGLQNILLDKDKIDAQKLPVTSDDIVGELAKSFNDIQTATNQNIEKIQHNQEQLIEQERLISLGQMIGGIAHNLKTPLMSISGASEGLNDLIDELDNSIGNPIVNDDDYHEIAHDMYEWTEKIKSYTDYMSDIISAVKGQTVNFSNETDIEFTLSELFKRVNILMKQELKRTAISLNISMLTDENTILKGDINSLVQVINNMIFNSIQAYNGIPNKNIDLIASSDGNNIIITVKDYGPGIPEKVKDKLFKEMITTKGKNGTGLGLYMSYSTIKAHFAGNITYESEKGIGTSFHIILPK